MKKKGSFASFPYFTPELWLHYIVQKSTFSLQFCADLSKKSRSVKAIYVYSSKKSRYPLSRNGLVYSVVTYRFEDTRV